MKIGNKIRQIRTLKGFSQDNMATELGISQKAYSLIENNESNINEEKLNKISKILKVTVDDIKNFNSDKIIHQNNHDSSTGYIVENLHQQNQDLLESLKQQYEQRIDDLKKENEFLKKLIAKK